MTAPFQIYLIRHGETAWSRSGQHTGRTESRLTAHGQEMARHLATTLKGIVFSLVLTSPRLRARATCELAGLGGSAQTEPNLAEWDYGDYEGLRNAEIRQLHPDGMSGKPGARAERVLPTPVPAQTNSSPGCATSPARSRSSHTASSDARLPPDGSACR